jgi:hypothetical protein
MAESKSAEPEPAAESKSSSASSSSASSGATYEAHIAGAAPEGIDDAGVDEHGLTVLTVSEADKADLDPLHAAGAAALGLSEVPFDPNAALRNKAGQGPGLQASEAIHPAVWVDENSDAAREAYAASLVADAEAALDKAKAQADAYKKGEPF